MAQGALLRRDERIKPLVDVVSELASIDEPRKRIAGIISGLDIHYDLGEGPACGSFRSLARSPPRLPW
jgi:hypothetical protein